MADACGNSSSCVQLLTRTIDTTAPTITCPLTAALACNATVPAGATDVSGFTAQGGTITDNCTGAITVSSSDAVSTLSCVETTTRTYTVTDACGNAATCTQTITRTVDTSAPIITCPADTTINCDVALTANTGTATATDNCGIFSINPSDVTTPGSCVNNYTIARTWTATDNCGNTASCIQTITVQDTTKPVAACQNITIALNPATGLATISASALNNGSTDNCGPVSFSASQTTFDCTDVGPNTVILTVTDQCGNQSTCTSTVTVTSDLAVTITPTSPTVCAGSDLLITASATGGNSVYTFSWTGTGAGSLSSTTISNPIFNNAINGTYILTVTITDGNGCTASNTISVVVGSSLILTENHSAAICLSSTSGFISVTVSGGSAPFNYLWSDAATINSANRTGLTAGTYTVTVTDANGCSSSLTVVIGTSSCGQFFDPCVCLDNASGLIPGDGQFSEKVTVFGGVGPYTVIASTNVYDFTLSPAPPGAPVPVLNGTVLTPTINPDSAFLVFKSVDATPWTITIQDSLGQIFTTGNVCSYPLPPLVSSNVTVCQNTTPAPDLTTFVTGTNLTWYASQTGGTGSASAPVVNTAVPSVNTYYVSQDPGPGCESPRSSITVTVNQNPVVSLVQDSVNCPDGADGSITATGSLGTGPYDYTITPDPNTQSFINAAAPVTFTGLTAGLYTVTITDDNGCTSTASITVLQPQGFEITASVVDSVSCTGVSDGTVTVNATGGTGGYTYIWTNSSSTVVGNTQTVTGLPGDIYTVTITDQNGCTITATVDLIDPASINISDNTTHVQCFGYATGAIDITVTGGTPPFTYAWSNGETTEDISGLVSDLYTVLVTDFHGCTQELTVAVDQNPQVLVGQSQTNVSCHNGNDGTATVQVSGGVGPYSYLWDNGDTTLTGFNLAPGTHTVIITDASATPGCDTIMSFLITNPTLLDATHTVVHVTCYGQSNGSITINAFGGNPPYVYEWSNSATVNTSSQGNLVAGVYTITITDSTGCVKNVVTQVLQPDSFYVTQSIDNASCFGVADGEATLIVVGGTPGYGYLWSDGQTTSTATGLAGGTYAVTVTDANGCVINVTVIVGQPSQIVITPTITNITCNGLINGSASVTASGGAGGYGYSWNTSPAQSSNTATGLASGTYTVVVTDASGCTNSLDITITQPDSINLNELITPVSCFGGANGAIDIFITGGTTPYTVFWNTGSTSATGLSGLTAGTYTVTVTDTSGCVKTQSFDVTQADSIIVDATVTNISCNGGANGAVTVVVSGGVGPYGYFWSNGETTDTISGLTAANYTLTVTDANGCSVTVIIPVTEPAALECVCNSNVNNVTCFGGSNGSITALPIGGTPPYSYSWVMISPSPSGVLAVTQTISGLTAGTYEVTITDANGCVKVGTATVTEPTQLVVNIMNSNVTCNGNTNGIATAVAAGGIPPYTYSWNTVPGQTTAIATGLGVGSYTVVVTDVNGCTASQTINITQPAVLHVTIAKTNVSCNGGTNGTASATPNGGTAPYFYLWSNGNTNSLATVLVAGTYTVTVSDVNGCTVSKTVTITQPSKIQSLYVVTKPTCFGSTNGAVDLTVTGGTPPYTYAWSNSATTQDVTGIGAGAYSVLITDSKGCVKLVNIIITQPTQIVISITSKNAACNGSATGKATANVTGGSGPYTYLWNTVPAKTTKTASGLAAGTYTVTVTDHKGCTATSSVTITQSATLVCSANVACMNNVTCFGGNNGKLCVTVAGGKAPYTYLWNTNPVATTAAVNNVPAGTYTVVVTDKNGCVTTCSFTITQPLALTATATGTNVSCNGAANGTAAVTASGGTAPYTYLWNNGAAATTSSISGLTPGIYTVTVTDFNGCTKTASITITQPAALTASVSHTNIACNGATTGTITVIATGGTAPLTYTLNPGAVVNGTGTFTGLAAGAYTVTVTDTNGCITSVTATITEPAALTMGPVTGTDVSCFGGNNGTAIAGTISGGTPPYVYLWNSSPVQGTATATGLNAGTYTVIVTDVNGCTVTGSIVINQPATALAISTTQLNIACNGGSTGSATVTASGGTTPYSYLWTDGQTNATATGLAAGTYGVVVTDSNGCEASTTVTILQPTGLSLTATVTDASCNGGANGTVTATATGGNPPYSYVLGTDTNSTGVFIGLAAGTYTVEAFDNGGCTAVTTVQVNEPSAIIANTTVINVSCNGGSNGSASVIATGGVTPYSYSWNSVPVQNTQIATGLVAGIYTVTITDANLCTITRTVTVAEPAALVITPTQVNAACNGGATGTATATVTGGTAPYFYQWSDLQMTSTATGLTAGTYTVTVTDYKGCTVTAVYVITESGSIAVNPSFAPLTCNGGTTVITVAPTGGSGSYTYGWSQDVLNTTASATVIAGTYYVTVTDGNGCSISVPITVTEPTALLCATNTTPAPCFGGNGTASVTASGGTPPYSYSWSNGGLTSSITDLAGPYAVVITDALGCITTCNVTIVEPAILSMSFSSSNTSCGNDNGTATAVVSGGNLPYTFLWSDGETTASVAGLPPGTYTITVNDANGCGPLTSTIVINANAPITCNIIAVNPTCTGYNNGSASVAATGGAGSYTYSWNTAPLQTTALATGLAAGTYEVTITDVTGCTSLCTVDIIEPDPLAFTVEQLNVNCSGAGSGSAIITVFGGTPYTVGSPYTYLWDNGQTTATATGLSVGSYAFTITDSAGCSISGSIILYQNTTLSCNASSTFATCGQANGSATVNVFGGTAPFSYQWNTVPVQTNANATLLTAGTYTVVVTDANGCSTQCTAIVQQAGAVTYTLVSVPAACNGGNGSLSVFGLSGGTPPYTYAWSNAAVTSSISAAAGTYTVTVTDSAGCSVEATGAITEPTALGAISAIAGNVTCNGNADGFICIAMGGGVQPYSYQWSNGANVNCIYDLSPGTYTLTVTDANGCTFAYGTGITEPAVLDTISTSSTPASCGLNDGTGTVNVTGGTAPYTYDWQTVPSQTTPTATGLASGNNFVIITDAAGCSITVCVKVAAGSSFGLALNSPVYAGGVNIRCNGGADGSVNLTVSGTGPFTYNWSTGALTEDIFGLTAGTYTVTVSNGTCTSTASITLTQAPALNLTTLQTNVSCFGGVNGTATAIVSGGSPAYGYSWNTIPVQTNATATGLTAGSYTVTVSDANGCTQTALVTITQPASGLSITAVQVNPTCNGSSNGSIDVTITGGAPPYTYQWTGGQTTEDISGVSAGSHTITVTDANGCNISLCVVLVNPTAIQVTVSKTNISCMGGNNGSACVAATGGAQPYTYLWNIGATTTCINNLFAGTYSVTVTDANGCAVNSSTVVTQPVGMVLTISKTDVTTAGGSDGTASVSVSGGAAPFVYSWNTVPVKTTASITNLAAGTYQVTVVDANGCVVTGSVVITDPNYLCNPVTRPWRTESIVTWAVTANGNPAQSGQYLTNHFAIAFPAGLVVGGGPCVGSKTLTLTNATAVRNFLLGQPNTTSNVLTINLTNPSGGTVQNKLAAQLVALKLNVQFDVQDPNFAPLTTVALGNAIITGMTGTGTVFNGMTITQFLNEANKRLGNCTASPSATIAAWADAAEAINLAYLGGVAVNSGLISCPAGNNRIITVDLNADWNINAYPNPTSGVISIAFSAAQEGTMTMTMMDVTGRQVWNTIVNVVEGENVSTYDFSTLPKGIYMMNVKTADHSKVIRVVIQ
ncbi:MAG: T9SS type A sorting domain-containing protein [Bacteroidia bacterium]